MEEMDLAELALSIQAVGLIKPLVVEPLGERFKVVAGHRRFLACTMINYSPIPCRVKVNGTVDALAIMVAENAHTEAVNPIEEARFYERVLVELCESDCDLLAIKVRRRREYLEDRLNLLRGHPIVIDALQNKRISLAVARELNKVHDPARLLVFVDAAAAQGATARQVAAWRHDGDLLGPTPIPPDSGDGITNIGMAVPVENYMKCVLCESAEFPSMMEMLWVHKPCKVILKRLMGHNAEGQPGPG